MALLKISNLEKIYGNNTVLTFDEWTLESGTSWIKGGNGTGKTTLFKVICGQTPFKGEVVLDNVSLKKQPTIYRSLISYAEAEPQFPPFITGKELLNYFIKVRKATSAASNKLTEAFEMTPYMNNKLEGYSSGMLKKLSLICAFVGEQQLYLLDEPLITIDAAAAEVLYSHIEWLQEQDVIVLLSSHQEVNTEALRLTNSFIIQDKKIVQC